MNKRELLESKLRRIIQEELLKEEYNASAEAKKLMNICKTYIRNEINLDLFLKQAKDVLDTIKWEYSSSKG